MPYYVSGGASSSLSISGVQSEDDNLVWNGSVWVPKFRKVVVLGSSFSVSSSSMESVTDLVITIPRAGTYKFRAVLMTAHSNTPDNLFVVSHGFNFTGTYSKFFATCMFSRAIATQAAGGSTDLDAALTFTTRLSADSSLPVNLDGKVVATGVGVIQARARNFGGTYTIQDGYMEVFEV